MPNTLAARFVIHAVSLDRDRRTSGQSIEQAVRSTFARARELGVTSLAFPALGTGVGGFPLDEAARIMVDVAHDELPKSPIIDYLIFALRGVAAYRQFEIALAHGEDEATQDAPDLASSSASPRNAKKKLALYCAILRGCKSKSRKHCIRLHFLASSPGSWPEPKETFANVAIRLKTSRRRRAAAKVNCKNVSSRAVLFQRPHGSFPALRNMIAATRASRARKLIAAPA